VAVLNNKTTNIILQVVSPTAFNTTSVMETDERKNMDSVPMTLCSDKKSAGV
jgi:hypothetical protein